MKPVASHIAPARLELAIGRVGSGQRWAEPKPGLVKIGRIFYGQNFNSPACPKNPAGRAKWHFEGKKKIRVDWAGHGHTGPGQIWPDFFRDNNLMPQPGPNSGRTGLTLRVRPILSPLRTALPSALYCGAPSTQFDAF